MISIMKEIWEGLKNDLCLRVILYLFAATAFFLFIGIWILIFFNDLG